MTLLLFLIGLLVPQRPYFDSNIEKHTHVSACGVVEYVKKEADGDYHFRMTYDGRKLYLEIIPAIPLPKPPKNECVCAKGISRIDPTHGWLEIHPVESWELCSSVKKKPEKELVGKTTS